MGLTRFADDLLSGQRSDVRSWFEGVWTEAAPGRMAPLRIVEVVDPVRNRRLGRYLRGVQIVLELRALQRREKLWATALSQQAPVRLVWAAMPAWFKRATYSWFT
jgi:hypothetical protein